MDYYLSKQVLCYGAGIASVTTVAFDDYENLLWTGTSAGHVTSYSGSYLDKYTSFQVTRDRLCRLVTCEPGVLSLTPSQVLCTARTGLALDAVRDLEGMADLQDMVCLPSRQEVVFLGSLGGRLLALDLEKKEVSCHSRSAGAVRRLKESESVIWSGEESGAIGVYEPATLNRVHTVTTRWAGLTDMEVVGPYLVTCGLIKQHKRGMPANELAVYDVRKLSPLPYVAVHRSCDPFLLCRLSPAYPSSALVVSQLGYFQTVDLTGLVTMESLTAHQLGTAGYATCLDVSPSAECVAFGDSKGVCHLYTSKTRPILNYSARETVFPDNVMPTPYISWNEKASVPLSMVPVPRTTPSGGQLVSQWPVNVSMPYRRPHPAIPPEIMAAMKKTRCGAGHAPRPPWLLPNQCPYPDPRRWGQNGGGGGRVAAAATAKGVPGRLSLVPPLYQRTEIKYAKYGIDECNQKNSTMFAGLEINIPNDYCNSLLQVLYFLAPVRCAMESHLCPGEFCLSCELGFLFRMLDVTTGTSCQASNFLRAFRSLKEARRLKLLVAGEERGLQQVDLCELAQSWMRFVLQQINSELQQDPQPSLDPLTVEKLFGAAAETTSVCTCGTSSVRHSTELLFSLSYPEETAVGFNGRGGNELVTFTDILQQSLCREQKVGTWCENCKRYRLTTLSKKLSKLPNVLVLNSGLDKEQGRAFWRRRLQRRSNNSGRGGGKLCWPLSVSLSLSSDGRLMAALLSKEEEDDGRREQQRAAACYDLVAVVGLVRETMEESPAARPGHLIAHVRVGKSYHVGKRTNELDRQWYLFNDMSVHPIRESTAAEFCLDWLTPCVLVYAQRHFEASFPVIATVQQLRAEVLLCETHPQAPPPTTLPLSLQELSLGMKIVGLDTEFVSLSKEQAEVHTNWTSNTSKPRRFSVARITVVRGAGPSLGVPFIDDYIAASEAVEEYLTEYSGIYPGDLDPATSTKHITTFKASYLKLLFLLQSGAKFVGHGLKQDFKVLNLQVPKEQVIDTVELFHLPNKRSISLRFLAWHYLRTQIQVGPHDSIEDARTAVQLYHQYKVLLREERLSESLQRLYKTGSRMSWQLPF